jgi:dynein heavy chain
LKDFNWPKIIVDDRAIFSGLIGDLFPGIPDESKIDLDLQAQVRQITKDEGLQPEDGFVLKVVQTAEILVVRHCMFIIGNPGCAKSTIWKILAKTMTSTGHDTVFDIIDPKAITADELYGCMNPKTKEWKDGVLSVIMRDMNKNNAPYKPSHKYKWIILDGDVDPEWIESLNTVMDDNKVLTLVS